MAIFKILVLLTIFCNVHVRGQSNNSSAGSCPKSLCGNFTLFYPFKLQDTNTQSAACPPINLTCTHDQNIKVSLAHTRQFYVRMINHYPPYIVQLHDPGNCLMAQLMQPLDLSSSPFQAFRYENYTYYRCPSNNPRINDSFQPIWCLSDSTNLTIATAFFGFDSMLELGCQVIGSWMHPVLVLGQFEFDGVGSDLYLTWNSSRCVLCEGSSDRSTVIDDPGDSLWASFAGSAFFLPAFSTIAIIIFVICLLSARRSRASGNDDDTFSDGEAVSSQQVPGMDESKIIACTELVVISDIERKTNTEEGDDSMTCCSICLEGYCPNEVLRSINKCHHSFHAHCLQQWLTKNNNCPVCRTILTHADHL